MDLFDKIRFGIKIMEGLACIAAFASWAKLRPGFWKTFPFYLLIIVCCEFAGWYMNKNGLYKPAKSMYSFFVVPLEFLYAFFLFYMNLAGRYKKVVLSLAGLYIVSLLAENILLQHKKWIWLSASYAVGCIGLMVLITIYFLELIIRDVKNKYTTELFYWVCLGLVVFYVGTLPYFTMPRNLYYNNQPLFWVLNWVFVILNYVMYSLFITGFICCKPKMN